MKRKLLNQIQALIKEGEKFTFKNFCYPSEDSDIYNGEDRPEWITWKTRSYNLIIRITTSNSPATTLAETARKIETEDEDIGEFERQKEMLIKALKLTAQNIKNDTLVLCDISF